MVENILKKIDMLPLHPKYKLELYQFYLMSKISWHLTIADIEKTRIKENVDNLCHNKLRRWLEIPLIDIVLLAKTKFGLNVIDVSTKHAQCQISFRSQLKNSTNEDARPVYSSTRSGCNIQYDRFNNCREVLIKEIRDEKLDKVNKLVSHSIVVKALWQETLVSDVIQWHRTLNKLPKNIFNFCIRYLNNTLPALKNMVLWKKSENALSPSRRREAPCEGTNSPRLFAPGETKALAKSKVHQLSRAWVTNDVGVCVGGHPH
jgi:hypothetical protein